MGNYAHLKNKGNTIAFSLYCVLPFSFIPCWFTKHHFCYSFHCYFFEDNCCMFSDSKHPESLWLFFFFFLICLFWDGVLLCGSSWPWTLYVGEACFHLTAIQLPWSLESWDCAPPHPASESLWKLRSGYEFKDFYKA